MFSGPHPTKLPLLSFPVAIAEKKNSIPPQDGAQPQNIFPLASDIRDKMSWRRGVRARYVHIRALTVNF
jgi:hypothetical protein